MHILFISDNFPPEGNAPATRTFEHAREWVIKGHEVTVVTCAPNFPEGKVFEGYTNKWLSKEIIEGINVWRVKTFITANQGLIKRTIDFVSFMSTSLFFGLFTRKVDVVVGTSPQFFTVMSTWALAKLKNVPFVFELRDMWPASITAVGAVTNNRIIHFFEKIELFLYHQADLIISVTHSFKIELGNRGITLTKIKVVLNGVDLEIYKRVSHKDRDFSDQYGLQDKFVVGYIGTHGVAHALDHIMEAAERLKAEDHIRIVFAGGGAERLRLEQVVKHRSLTNVIMIPRQPKDRMPQLWSLCDLSIVHLKNTPLFKTVIPSKIFESMAMGLPILISTPEGEATEIIKKHGAGVIVPAENAQKLSEKIIELAANKELVSALSLQSECSARHFDRKKLALDMLKHIQEVVN